MKNKSQCEKIERWDREGNPIFRSKKKFETLDKAIEAAKKVNSFDDVFKKTVAYKCPVCFKYHIGRNGKILTEKEKQKLRNAKL